MTGIRPYKVGPDSASECGHYSPKSNGRDSVKDCGTCLLEQSCLYGEMIQLRKAIDACLPLYMKPNRTGVIVLDFLRRAELRLFDLIQECQQRTSKGTALVVPGSGDKKILPLR